LCLYYARKPCHVAQRVEHETRAGGLQTAALIVSGLMVHNRRMKYGYARISTIDQNADMRLKAFQRAGLRAGTFSKTSYPARRRSALPCSVA
jgi:hypothetical protein